MLFLSEHIRSAEWLAPTAAPCEHKKVTPEEIINEALARIGKPLAQGRWRPCTERPNRVGEYRVRPMNRFVEEFTTPRSWNGDKWEWATGMNLAPDCEYFDPGSQGDEQRAAQETDGGKSGDNVRAVAPVAAHQELAALRAECRRIIGTYTRVAKFGEREI